MRRLFTLFWLLVISASGVSAQQVVFKDVKIRRHRSAEKRVLVDKYGTLTFDDSARKLNFESDAGDHIEVGYEAVGKVVFDTTTHMRGGALAQVVQAAPLAGPVVGGALAGAHISNYWFYVGYKDHERDETVLLEVPKGSTAEVINKATSVFGSRVTVSDFRDSVGTAVKREDLQALKTKQALKVEKQNHPLPEVKPDKATVVVVCPPLAARDAGRGNQFKLHANDQVIAVNRMGTYSFAYLNPGKYRLVSQSENANGFDLELEAGHEYFFLQNTFQGFFKGETSLSRNSPELVSYLLDGSYFSDWKPREK